MKNYISKCLSALLILCLLLGAASAENMAPVANAPGRPQGQTPVVATLAPTATPTPEPTATPTPTPTPEPPQDLALWSKGETVRLLQIRLIELGFLNDSADGVFGNKTQQAVLTLEKAIAARQQKAIDEMIEANATPVPSPTPEPTEPAPDEQGTTPLPTATPEPTSIPTPVPTPEQVVDGIAEAELVERVLREDFDLYLATYRYGDRGDDIARIQTRLTTLNYLNDVLDNRFGDNTLTALLAFQQKNGLPQTGEADEATQRLLFSDQPVVSLRPVYNLLYQGVSSDGVKKLQRELIVLGFMSGAASGSFDARTTEGVKRLQTYLHRLEPAPTPEPTAEPISTAIPGQTQVVSAPIRVTPVPAANATPQHTPEPDDGFEPSGIADAALQTILFDEGIPIYRMTVQKGDNNDEVTRIQRRLYGLEYLFASGVDGVFGGGTEKALRSFQSRNKLPQTGIADQATQAALFSEDAVKALKPYLVKVSVDDQRVYVYSPDSNEKYTVLVKTMVCSTGLKSTPTPTGEFTHTGPGARWHYFTKWKCWAQYAYYIDGDIMFHSVLFNDDDESTLIKGSKSALGKRASHGCVRLAVEDAKWIWSNCPSGTHVIIY